VFWEAIVKMSVVIVDVHEHGEIPKKLRALLQVHVQALEPLGFCDYLYYGFDNHSITLERKHWSDLINSIDRVEVQLRKATKVANEVGLLVEGVAVPTDDCQTITFEERYVKKSGNIMFISKESCGSLRRLVSLCTIAAI
jgi:ERCC4-type nuclease